MTPKILTSKLPCNPVKQVPFARYVWDGLKANPNGVVIIDSQTDRKYTGAEVLKVATNLAVVLRENYGLQTGDVVCLSAPSSDLAALAMIGILFAGGVFIGVGDSTKSRELSTLLDDVSAKFLFCGYHNLETAFEVKKNAKTLRNVILLHDDAIETANYSQNSKKSITSFDVINLLDYVNKEIKSKTGLILPVERKPEDMVTLMLTSGSTGKPKQIVHTDSNMFWMTHGGGSYRNYETQIFEIGPGDVCMAYALNHMSGTIILYRCCGGGATMVTKREADYNNENILKYVQKYRTTKVMFLPTDLRFLVTSPAVDKYDLSSIEAVFYGAAPTPEELYNKVTSKFKWHMFEGYAMSEMGMITGHCRGQITSNPRSVGHVSPTVQLQIVDHNTGERLGANEVGEICVTGPAALPGYLNNPEANKASFTKDGFFRTGDMGYYDDQEQLFIIGRLKEIILVDGAVVAPAELEKVLAGHVAVLEAAVVGVADDVHGEVPRAFVTLKPGFDKIEFDVFGLLEFVNSQVNRYKQLRGGVYVIDAFPRSNIGKIVKSELNKLI